MNYVASQKITDHPGVIVHSQKDGWLDRMLIAAFDRLADHSMERSDVAALARMDAHMLKDIGLTPEDLDRVVDRSLRPH